MSIYRSYQKSDKIEAETKKGREPVACDLDVTPEEPGCIVVTK